MNYENIMHNLKNNIRRIISHPVSHIVVIDIVLIAACAIILYIAAETILPGVVSNVMMPYAVFVIFLALSYASIILAKKTGRSFPVTRKNRLLYAVALLVFIAIITIANYRFGILYGTLMTAMSIMLFVILSINYYDILDR